MASCAYVFCGFNWPHLLAEPFGSAVISVCQHVAAVSMPSRAGAVVVWRRECVPQAAGVSGREPESGTAPPTPPQPIRRAAMFFPCWVTPSVAAMLQNRSDLVGLVINENLLSDSLQTCQTPHCLTLKLRLPAHQTSHQGNSQVGAILPNYTSQSITCFNLSIYEVIIHKANFSLAVDEPSFWMFCMWFFWDFCHL